MVRLYLFAEGQTEQTFADTLIKPHLALHEVFMNRPQHLANVSSRSFLIMEKRSLFLDRC